MRPFEFQTEIRSMCHCRFDRNFKWQSKTEEEKNGWKWNYFLFCTKILLAIVWTRSKRSQMFLLFFIFVFFEKLKQKKLLEKTELSHRESNCSPHFSLENRVSYIFLKFIRSELNAILSLLAWFVCLEK